MQRTVINAIMLWLLILGLAIANAALREKLLTPVLGASVALPVSGLLLAVIILVVAWFAVPRLALSQPRFYILIGVLWFTLTLAFELVLGRVVMGQSWQQLLSVFDVTAGNLFSVALLSTLISPWLCARLQRWPNRR